MTDPHHEQWEYAAKDASDWPLPEQLTEKFGSKGWEVIGMYPRGGSLTIYMKRRKLGVSE